MTDSSASRLSSPSEADDNVVDVPSSISTPCQLDSEGKNLQNNIHNVENKGSLLCNNKFSSSEHENDLKTCSQSVNKSLSTLLDDSLSSTVDKTNSCLALKKMIKMGDNQVGAINEDCDHDESKKAKDNDSELKIIDKVKNIGSVDSGISSGNESHFSKDKTDLIDYIKTENVNNIGKEKCEENLNSYVVDKENGKYENIDDKETKSISNNCHNGKNESNFSEKPLKENGSESQKISNNHSSFSSTAANCDLDNSRVRLECGGTSELDRNMLNNKCLNVIESESPCNSSIENVNNGTSGSDLKDLGETTNTNNILRTEKDEFSIETSNKLNLCTIASEIGSLVKSPKTKSSDLILVQDKSVFENEKDVIHKNDTTPDKFSFKNVDFKGENAVLIDNIVRYENDTNLMHKNLVENASKSEDSNDKKLNDPLDNVSKSILFNASNESKLSNKSLPTQNESADNSNTVFNKPQFSEDLTNDSILPEEACVQTVIKGSLQPLNAKAIQELDEDTQDLFVGVTGDLNSLESSADENSMSAAVLNRIPDDVSVDGDISQHLESSSLSADTDTNKEVEIIDLSGGINIPNIDIENITNSHNSRSPNESVCPEPSAKRIKLDDETTETSGALLLKVLPIENGHLKWTFNELRLLLAETGTAMLRLCIAPEAINDDLVDNTEIDFTAVLVDGGESDIDGELKIKPEQSTSTLPSNCTCTCIKHESSGRNNSSSMPEMPFDTLDNYFPSYETTPLGTPLWPTQRFKRDPVFKPNYYYMKKALNPTRGTGKKRGRPPLANRVVVTKQSAQLKDSLTPSKSEDPFKEPDLNSSLPGTDKVKENGEEKLNSNADDETPIVRISNKKMKRHPCDLCDQVFVKKVALNNHVKIKHRVPKKCPICDVNIRYRGKNTLRLHMNKEHNFPCEECDESLKTQDELDEHMKMHEDEDVIEDVVEKKEPRKKSCLPRPAAASTSLDTPSESEEDDDDTRDEDFVVKEKGKSRNAKRERPSKSKNDVSDEDDDDDEEEEVSSPSKKSNLTKREKLKNDFSDKDLDDDDDIEEDGDDEDDNTSKLSGKLNKNAKQTSLDMKTRSSAAPKWRSSMIKELKNLELDPLPKHATADKAKVGGIRTNKKYSIRDDAKKRMMEKLKKMRESEREQTNLHNKLMKEEKVRYRSSQFKKMLAQKEEEERLQKVDEDNDDEEDEEEEEEEEEDEQEDDDGNSNEESSSEVEEDMKFPCDSCNLGFSHKFKLKNHMKEKHSKEEKREDLTCEFCGRECRNSTQLKLHLSNHTEANKVKTKRKVENISSNKNPNKLDIPGKVKMSRELRMLVENDETAPKLRKYVKSIIMESMSKKSVKSEDEDDDEEDEEEEEEDESENEKPVKRAGNNSKVKPPTNKINKDRIPNTKVNKFKPQNKKVQNTIIVRRGKYYYCTECNLTFKKEKFCTYHMKKIHETLYPFKACEHCGMIFRSCGPYKRHILKHKVHTCPLVDCNVKFRTYRRMRQHHKSAHSDKPFRCARCISLFSKKSELKTHMEKEHNLFKSDDDEDDDEDEDEEEEKDNECEDEEEKAKEKKESKPSKPASKKNDSLPTKRKTRSSLSYTETEEDDDVKGAKSKRPVVEETEDDSSSSKASKSDESDEENSESSDKLSSNDEASNDVPTSKQKKTNYPKLPPHIPFKTKKIFGRKVKVPLVLKKKKVSKSWTAALKAQIRPQDLRILSRKPETIINLPLARSSEPIPPSESTSGLTEHIVNRVTESLVAKTTKAPKKPKRPYIKKKMKKSSKANNDNETSSQSAGYGVKYGEDEFNPAKVLRFDLF